MQKQGTVLRWDATRGFGFIRSGDTGVDVFFHARDLQGFAVPTAGMAVVYEEIHVGGKGPRAMAVRAAASTAQQRARPDLPRAPSQPSSGHRPSQARAGKPSQEGPRRDAGRRTPTASGRPRTAERPAPRGGTLALVLMAAWLALLAWGAWSHRLPMWWLGALAGLNLVTFAVYATDKAAAQSGGRRTSEKRLHLLAVLGGWPAAWWAQQWLRHKSSKASFRSAYWGTVVVHCVALVAVLFWQGALLLHFR